MSNDRRSPMMSARPWETWLATSGFVLALAAYGVGAWQSPLLDKEYRAHIDVLSRYAGSGILDERRERDLSDTYWSRYPDVGDDAFFGRKGVLGLWGAREHHKRHGKREGRTWPR